MARKIFVNLPVKNLKSSMVSFVARFHIQPAIHRQYDAWFSGHGWPYLGVDLHGAQRSKVRKLTKTV